MGAWRDTNLRALLVGSLIVTMSFVGLAVTDAGPASASNPVSLYVAIGGTGNCTSPATACGSIHSAITTAQSGSYSGLNVTINVAAGVYIANETISASTLTSLAIVGAGAPATTVNGNHAGSVFTINTGTVTISGVTIENGSAPNGTGGGIFNGASLTVTGSTISNNDALGGGGIENYRGILTVRSSTISGNGGQAGGGIETVQGGLNISDSTLWGNTAITGGGIENLSSSMTITSSTLFANGATSNGGGIFTESGTDRIGATIVAGNDGSNCYDGTGGVVSSVGYNLTDDATGASCGFTQPTDVVNAHPQLGLLADNGGPTESLLPALGSPAIGAIPSSPATILNSVQVCPRADQRGVGSAGNCSIGAVEGGSVTPAPIITTFTPNRGPVGTVVTITGVNLSGATKVIVHGVTATITKDIATKIKIMVPAGATTGKIKVVTPGGTVKTGTFFTVT